jgi:cation diffusion facilitator family transporter
MSKKISDNRVVLTSSVVSVGDVAINLAVGIITGSTVMFAQALQGLSDLITSGLLLYGVGRSKQKTNTRFQFGYGREIFFWVLMAGIIMFLGTGLISIIMGFQQFRDPQVIQTVYLALGILVFNLITNGYAFSLSVRRLKEQSPDATPWWSRIAHSSIVETKATFFVDLLGMLAAVIGLVAIVALILTGDARLDGIGSMAIGIAMMLAAGFLIHDVRQFIVGRAASPQLVDDIITAVEKIAPVHSVLDLRTMYLGSGKLLIIIEVHLKDSLTTESIEKTIDIIKQNVNQSIPGTHHIQVEVETPNDKLVQTT